MQTSSGSNERKMITQLAVAMKNWVTHEWKTRYFVPAEKYARKASWDIVVPEIKILLDFWADGLLTLCKQEHRQRWANRLLKRVWSDCCFMVLTSFSAALSSTNREPWPGFPGQFTLTPGYRNIDCKLRLSHNYFPQKVKELQELTFSLNETMKAWLSKSNA